MNRRRWTIRTRILTLLFAPLVPLLAMLIFATTTALGPALNLRDANAAAINGALPAATVLFDLQAERELSVILVSSPTPVPQTVAALTAARAQTDSSYGSLQKAVTGGDFTSAASPEVVTHLDLLKAQLVRLEGTRNAIDRGTSRVTVMTYYNGAIEDTFGLYGSIASLDDHTLARQANTVVNLAEASEMLAREDALLAGPLTAGSMTTNDYTQLVGTINTKRYLYTQATRYLTGPEANSYAAITKSEAYTHLTAMENTLIAHPAIGKMPVVNANEWHTDFTTVSTALGLFEAGEATSVITDTHTAAVDREWRLAIIVGGSVLMTLILLYFSVVIARATIRRITALRQDALSLALDRLPSVVERLRNGEAVDVEAETPPLRHRLRRARPARRRVHPRAEHRDRVRGARGQPAPRFQPGVPEHRPAQPDAAAPPARAAGRDGTPHRTIRTSSRSCSASTTSPPGCGATPRTWSSWPARRPVAAGASRCRSPTCCAPPPPRSRSTPGSVVVGLPDIALAGRAVNDVVHLLAELLENATMFSPPDTQVALSGPSGAERFRDRDRGPRPRHDRRGDRGRQRAPGRHRPTSTRRTAPGSACSWSSRLAARQNIEVGLRRSPYGGVTAVALIPVDLVVARPKSARGRWRHAGTPHSGAAYGDRRVRRPRQRARPRVGGRRTGRADEMALRAPAAALTVDGLPQRVRQASLSRQLQEHASIANGAGFAPIEFGPERIGADTASPAARHSPVPAQPDRLGRVRVADPGLGAAHGAATLPPDTGPCRPRSTGPADRARTFARANA